MTRRALLAAALAVPGGRIAQAWLQTAPPGGVGTNALAHRVETVTGPIDGDALGLTLVHEHVLVDFVGARDVSPSRYDAEDAFRRVLPFLQQARALGCRSLVECTPAYLARDPHLLRRLAEASGVQILTNTGYYGAADDKFVPAHAFTETAAQLAARWIREWEHGIEGTDIKPAFMKIAVDAGRLSAIDAKLVDAAALTHRATGLPIASHTGDGIAAEEQLDRLEAAGVPLSAFIWVHAQGEKDHARHVRAATRGAWVEFDGVGPKTVARHVELVARMKDDGVLGRVLVSHDAGWYRVGEPGGGEFRPYDTIFTSFIPAVRTAGFTDADVEQLLTRNPREALTRAT